MFKLLTGIQGMPVLPMAGADYSQESHATRESLIAVALEMLRRIDLTGRYVHKDSPSLQGAVNAAMQMQEAAQRASVQRTLLPAWVRTEAAAAKPTAAAPHHRLSLHQHHQIRRATPHTAATLRRYWRSKLTPWHK